MNSKRFLALFLSMLMLLSAFPASIYAESNVGTVEPEETLELSTLAEDVIFEMDEASEDESVDALQDADTPIDEVSIDTPEEAQSSDAEQQEDVSSGDTEDVTPVESEDDTTPEDDRNALERAIGDNGFAYVKTASITKAFSTAGMADESHMLTFSQVGAILLATDYIKSDEVCSVKVWFLSDSDKPLSVYVSVTALADSLIDDDEIEALTDTLPSAHITIAADEHAVFYAEVEKPNTPDEESSEDEPSQEQGADDDEELLDDLVEELPLLDDLAVPETDESDIPTAQIGDFIAVGNHTRVYSSIDETASNENDGDLCLGVFVKNANVQIEVIEQDSLERTWYKVRYMYGDDFADGRLKWTDYGTVYVLADETDATTEQEYNVTDVAFMSIPAGIGRNMRLLATTPMNGFSLKSINGSIGSFYSGQSGVHGSSGRDSDYRQIATVAGHGTVYATPHYLNGFTVYCLEHTMPGPGERISGGGQQPTGPYMLVDMESYLSGGSTIKYKASTLHAIGWVLRHSYPFMALDRSDSDNEAWSRVAGQFAIREVIKQMEGSHYVRDYWNMDNFYVASGQAPSVYLEYARWLATNGIAHGRITGKITATNKTVTYASGSYKGTVTLTTDADLMRISRNVGTVTGNTAGQDSSYYYLKSGDTISVSFAVNGFSFNVESVSSDTEEASFLIGTPSASIQDVLVPTYGYPYKLDDASVMFEILYGDLTVTKRRDRGDQQILPNAQLQLYDGSGNAIGSPVTTDSNGRASWTNLQYGTYYVSEISAPTGYQLTVDRLSVTINSSVVTATFRNTPIIGSIRVVKKASNKDIPLVGAKYELVSRAGNDYVRAVSVIDGSPLPVLTTDANGRATWENVVEYGEYYVHEVEPPEGYLLDNAYHRVNITGHNTLEISGVTDDPITGRIRIQKKDQLTQEPLYGAVFTITRLSAPVSHNGAGVGEVVAVITTDADGTASTGWLEWGRYRIAETTVPPHYVDNQFSVEVDLYENGKTYVIDVENEPTKGWLRLTKTDRQNGNPIEGVQFDVFYNDEYGSGLACTMITDKDGIAISEPLRKGKYIVFEHGETAGYLFEEIVLNATVKSDETTDLSATNRHVTVRLKLYKRDVDEYTGDNPNASANAKPNNILPVPANISAPAVRGDGILTGAVFQVLAGADITDRQGNVVYPKGAVIIESIKTSGADASVTTDELWPGLYEIVELTPPTGYQPSDKSIFVDTRSAATQSTEAIITYEGLVTNEIKYGVYAIVKFLGDNEVHNDAGIIETPEQGAEFQLYLKSAGSYENARTFERDYLVTNRYGYAVSKPIPYGLYVLNQVKGEEGHAIKSPVEIFIRGTEDPKDPPILIINNEAIRYRLKLIKIDAETGKTIAVANTAFKLKDSDGEYVTQTLHYPVQTTMDTFYTNESGEVTLPETVRRGMYFIEELISPDGYLILNEDFGVFVGDDSTDEPGEAYLVEIEIPNEPVKGSIIIEKTGPQLIGFEEITDAYGNTYQKPIYEERYLEGVVFEVYAAEDIFGKEGTLWYQQDELVDAITTSVSGSDASMLLPLGKYYLIETHAPEGYVFNNVRYDADLQFADNTTAVVETIVAVGNEYLPAEIVLYKEKEITKIIHGDDNDIRQIISVAPGEGFVFGLFNKKDIHYGSDTLMADTLLATGATDSDGYLQFAGTYPHGDYYIKELSAPGGWKLNPNPFEISIHKDMKATDANVIRIILPEAIHNELIYTTITITKTDITGQNTLPDTLIEVKNENGDVIFRAFTDENGHIADIPVIPGKYTFKEILAPEGYSLNEAEMSFTVDKDGNVTGDTVIRDDYTRFFLQKQDENGKPLAGVVFRLVKTDGSKVFTATSNEEGLVVFEKIPYGKYTLAETKPLPGYLKNDTAIEITVDGTFVNPTEPLATIKNYPMEVILLKVDQDGKPLAGATFGLFDAAGMQVMTAVSDANGTVRFSKIPYGAYTIRETVAPKGYLISKEIIELSLFETHHNITEPMATIINRLKRFQFKKVDTSGKPLPGVEFRLVDATTGQIMETVTSNEKGEFIFTKFDIGEWLVSETKAPEGYNKMKDYRFTVDENWIEPAPITFTNIPNHYEFVKTDNRGNPLAGVKFTLEDASGNIIRYLLSGDDGIVRVTDLAPGAYVIREIQTLDGYILTEETIQVVIDEKYIVPAEMYRLVNYSNIQTGVDFTFTPVMWLGAALVLAGTALAFVYFAGGKRKPKPKRK